ncbi:hypothetical protein [Halomicrobium katesii]|uniref:hypothetical protein n=1 Tax=Halomicrobium katesii TaxID=437163 RepID=UPI000376FD7C|nr:hypothetical protein [Halomicrobium katesii]
MGFDDLDNAEQESDDDQSEATPADHDSTPTHESMSETTTEPEHESESESESDSLDEPAFAYDDVKQDAIYARESSLNELGDALAELDLKLRKRDLRDVPKREKHDALARLAGDHVDELADLVEAARAGESE